MFNKYSTVLYAAIISSVVVACVFAISFMQQQVLAQGNKIGGGSSNQTSGAAGSNRASGNLTGGGTAANATY